MQRDPPSVPAATLDCRVFSARVEIHLISIFAFNFHVASSFTLNYSTNNDHPAADVCIYVEIKRRRQQLEDARRNREILAKEKSRLRGSSVAITPAMISRVLCA